jgi:hypothetical protein
MSATTAIIGRNATPAHLQPLEQRRLLSVAVAEAEPNNARAQANVVPHVLDEHVLVSGRINAPGDHDWFKVQLNAGDIIGGALAGQGGLDTILRLFNNSGKLMIGDDDCNLQGLAVHPPESPLPHIATNIVDSEIYYTMKSSGTYYLEVSAFQDATAGSYSLDFLVTRPALERAPLGTKQILFLDFDGAKIGFLDGTAVDPLAKAMPAWGLTAADENTVIDNILRVVTDKLSTFPAAKGGNANFGIEIRNSRDNADEYGSNPYVSRIAVGPLRGHTPPGDGVAQFIDVGNFDTHDEAVVTTDFMTAAIRDVPVQPPLTVLDGLGIGIGDLISHEAGHLFGCYHTDQPSIFEGTPNLMDPVGSELLGPDLILGTKDDVVREFGVDAFARNELFEGIDDTLTTAAYGLSMGKGAATARAMATLPLSGSTRFNIASPFAHAVDRVEALPLV